MRKQSPFSTLPYTPADKILELRPTLAKREASRTDILYAITNRKSYGKDGVHVRECLLRQVSIWAANGVAFVQLREKDLAARNQVEMARAMMGVVRAETPASGHDRRTRLLINGRPDVALAAGADGVHLPSGGALTPEEVRQVFAAAGRRLPPAISISCHTLAEIEIARSQHPDCILFAPVFEKILPSADGEQRKDRTILAGVGRERLQQACRTAAPVPVFALGGVTADNAGQCVDAGAAGIAAIRWMQKPPERWRRFSR